MDFSGKPSFWKALKPPAKDKCGDLLISLCYHPSNSILTLSLIKARNLKAKDINGKSGNQVKTVSKLCLAFNGLTQTHKLNYKTFHFMRTHTTYRSIL